MLVIRIYPDRRHKILGIFVRKGNTETAFYYYCLHKKCVTINYYSPSAYKFYTEDKGLFYAAQYLKQ